ncbi:NAD(+) diphosphatase [Paracoccus contaminans]|uniref:NAD(+) diphosphatase n=1 Tax=Paracoccus contaminans TaxID=1945662 RepID=A0A1W6CZ25_9RHOB|nr:NAD(+) diphosphatase [Paracoccus contaminans]ARJ70123.1 NADH pyrophosphatase [Paracoccus contaminans]
MEMAFAGGGLDRAAHLRAGDGWQGEALVLPVWRGRVCARGEGLVRLEPGHPALSDGAPLVLLGLDGGQAIAAQDISVWAPASLSEQALFFDPGEQVHPLIADARFVELRGIMARLAPLDAELAASARALTGWHASHRFCAACGHPSEPRLSGWQRACPSCSTVHFPRTDPVVIMLVARGGRILLGRSHGWPDGMYSCLAGFIEPGETIEAAVRREVAEETGVTVGAVRYAASQPWPFPASLMLGMVAEAESEAITLDPAELEDALWLARDEVERVMAGTHPRIRAPREGAIARWLLARWIEGI